MRAICTLLLLISSVASAQVPTAPHQPFSFSHKVHQAEGMECASCHPNAGNGKNMGIPAASECMTCHKTVAHDKAEIRKLAATVQKKHEIVWTRVYAIPSFVKFSHRTHLAGDLKCDECHGPVATRDALYVEYPMTQDGCISCHMRRQVEAHNCFFCHTT